MELRNILDALALVKEEMRKLQKRAEIIETFLSAEANERDSLRQEKREAFLEELKENKIIQKIKLEGLKSRMFKNRDVAKLLERNPSATSKKYAILLTEYKAHIKNGILNAKDDLFEKKDDIIDKMKK